MSKGWYILVGVTVALIALLIGYAAYVTYENGRDCAPGVHDCGAPPGH